MYFQNPSLPASSPAHSVASASFIAFEWREVSGKWRYTQLTSLGYSSIKRCMVGWKRLQNGHSVSEYSTTDTLAFFFPLIQSLSVTATKRISPLGWGAISFRVGAIAIG